MRLKDRGYPERQTPRSQGLVAECFWDALNKHPILPDECATASSFARLRSGFFSLRPLRAGCCHSSSAVERRLILKPVTQGSTRRMTAAPSRLVHRALLRARRPSNGSFCPRRLAASQRRPSKIRYSIQKTAAHAHTFTVAAQNICNIEMSRGHQVGGSRAIRRIAPA